MFLGEIMERLQKVIASSGLCSRRKAEELITSGQVRVNDKIVTELGTKVDYNDEIYVDNKKISNEPKVYYMLNKPRGVISSTSDDKDRETVVDLIDTKYKIYPIGRLDYDTTGLLLLTNDGDLANILMHPSNRVPKTYLAKLNKVLTMEDYFKIKKGIIVDNEKVVPVRVKIKEKDEKKDISFVEITVVEGKNHLIKNIFQELHYDVIKLNREKYAFLTIKGLNSGEYRKLTLEEVAELYKYKKWEFLTF